MYIFSKIKSNKRVLENGLLREFFLIKNNFKRFCLKENKENQMHNISKTEGENLKIVSKKLNFLELKVNDIESLSKQSLIIQHNQNKKIIYSNLKLKIGKFLVLVLIGVLFWVSSGFYDIIPRYNIDGRIASYKSEKEEYNKKYYNKKE
jgi:hypothetical protein